MVKNRVLFQLKSKSDQLATEGTLQMMYEALLWIRVVLLRKYCKIMKTSN